MTPDELAQKAATSAAVQDLEARVREWLNDEGRYVDLAHEPRVFIDEFVEPLASAYLAQREEIVRLHAGAMISVQIEQRATDVRAERDELRAENTRIRAALAMSERPCVYCSLPADEWGKCKSGWPGCARSDDALGCPHLGDSMELDDLRAKLRRAKGLHVEDPNWGGCAQCDKDWPCPTRMALSGEP